MEVVDVCGSGVCTEDGQNLIILHINKPEEVVQTMKIKYGTMRKHILHYIKRLGARFTRAKIF